MNQTESKQNITISYFKTPYGELIIGTYKDKLCLADWRYRRMRSAIDKRIQSGLNADYVEGNSELIKLVKAQLMEYFEGDRTQFDIPLLFIGTDFQKQVWNSLLEIPYGQSKSYLQLSKRMGNEKAIRAVSTANGANAISIIVPCHRIIGSDGSLVGYAGGLLAKKKLLALENAMHNNQMELF